MGELDDALHSYKAEQRAAADERSRLEREQRQVEEQQRARLRRLIFDFLEHPRRHAAQPIGTLEVRAEGRWPFRQLVYFEHSPITGWMLEEPRSESALRDVMLDWPREGIFLSETGEFWISRTAGMNGWSMGAPYRPKPGKVAHPTADQFEPRLWSNWRRSTDSEVLERVMDRVDSPAERVDRIKQMLVRHID